MSSSTSAGEALLRMRAISSPTRGVRGRGRCAPCRRRPRWRPRPSGPGRPCNIRGSRDSGRGWLSSSTERPLSRRIMFPPGALRPRLSSISTALASVFPVRDDDTPMGTTESPTWRMITRRAARRAAEACACMYFSFHSGCTWSTRTTRESSGESLPRCGATAPPTPIVSSACVMASCAFCSEEPATVPRVPGRSYVTP